MAEREELGFAALRAMLFEVTLQAQMHQAVAATLLVDDWFGGYTALISTLDIIT